MHSNVAHFSVIFIQQICSFEYLSIRQKKMKIFIIFIFIESTTHRNFSLIAIGFSAKECKKKNEIIQEVGNIACTNAASPDPSHITLVIIDECH